MLATDHKVGITQARLKALIEYDLETGVFTWRVCRPNGVKPGNTAGHVHKETGYLVLKIDGRNYVASRLAFLYVTGDLPKCLADHADTDKLNNRWTNLRPANFSQNNQNKGLTKLNTTGSKGVSFDKERARWVAHIRVDGKLLKLGRFAAREEAAAAYAVAATQHFGHYARSV